MKAVYHLDLKSSGPDPSIPEGTALGSIKFEGIQVDMELAKDSRRLESVRLVITGVEMRRDSHTGSILSTYPELEARAFTAASFVANVLRLETGVDAIDPFALRGRSADISPETTAETQAFATSRKRVIKSLKISAAIHRHLNPSDWNNWGKLAQDPRIPSSLSSFAEGLRVQSPFLKYEQFFKVVEHFFPKKEGADLDTEVSKHVARFDPKFSDVDMKRLRNLRIRSIHAQPRASVGLHLSAQRIEDHRLVIEVLPELQHVALILMQNPPPP